MLRYGTLRGVFLLTLRIGEGTGGVQSAKVAKNPTKSLPILPKISQNNPKINCSNALKTPYFPIIKAKIAQLTKFFSKSTG